MFFILSPSPSADCGLYALAPYVQGKLIYTQTEFSYSTAHL